MPIATLDHISLYYEVTGPVGGPAVLLVNGFSQPLVTWPDGLVQGMARAGYRVITFDNRDVGKSQKMADAGKANLVWMMAKKNLGLPLSAPYGLADMAGDAVALMDYLTISKFHLAGASMGGMICQHIAARHPNRVLSLTSIMSSSGAAGLPQAQKDVLSLLYNSPPQTSPDMVRVHAQRFWRAIGSKTHPANTDDLLAMINRSNDWAAPDEAGIDRQFAAILSDTDRPGLLSDITAATLVLHGTEDGLLPPGCGMDTASRIAHARFIAIKGMGHDFPAPLLPTIVGLLLDHFDRNQHNTQQMKVKNHG